MRMAPCGARHARRSTSRLGAWLGGTAPAAGAQRTRAECSRSLLTRWMTDPCVPDRPVSLCRSSPSLPFAAARWQCRPARRSLRWVVIASLDTRLLESRQAMSEWRKARGSRGRDGPGGGLLWGGGESLASPWRLRRLASVVPVLCQLAAVTPVILLYTPTCLLCYDDRCIPKPR